MNGEIKITNDNVFIFRYLSSKYEITRMKEETEKYINHNYKELINDYLSDIKENEESEEIKEITYNEKLTDLELEKINKVIGKLIEGAPHETLLVVDATTGQNAIEQVKAFKEVSPITGLILTKLDGTAKGGVVIGIVNENKIPVKFIGVGEGVDDMEVFSSHDFSNAII